VKKESTSQTCFEGSTLMSELKFATRLNSFASGANLYWPDLQGKPSVLQMIARAGTVKG
jgi:xylose isomerase